VRGVCTGGGGGREGVGGGDGETEVHLLLEDFYLVMLSVEGLHIMVSMKPPKGEHRKCTQLWPFQE
jgi:hypothetical protein